MDLYSNYLKYAKCRNKINYKKVNTLKVAQKSLDRFINFLHIERVDINMYCTNF